MKNALIGLAAGIALTLALDACLGQRIGLVMFLAGVSVPVLGALLYLSNASRLRTVSDKLLRAAAALETLKRKTGPVAVMTPNVEAHEKAAYAQLQEDVSSALRNLGMPRVKASDAAHIAIAENPGANLETLIRVAIGRAA